MNEKKTPAELVWADGDGDMLWARAPHEELPTRSAAYVCASELGVFLTAAQCREVAAHFTALADAHEEAMSQNAPALPTKPGTVIVVNDGHEYVEAVVRGVVWRTREAVLGPDSRWRGVWRMDSGYVASSWSVRPEEITPGTWKVADQ